MNTLKLTLIKRWYDMIDDGVKLEEYRECKEYWRARLDSRNSPTGKRYDMVQFRNGYRKNSRTITFKVKHIWIGAGKQEWGAPMDRLVYIIELGERI